MKILWLSDIHFRADHHRDFLNTKCQEFITGFIKTLSLELPLDYIILSGDIAFAAKEDEYIDFISTIMRPIENLMKEKGQTTKIIVLPGNHDVSFPDAGGLFYNLKTENGLIEFYKSKKTEFANAFKRTQFLNLFNSYLLNIKKICCPNDDEKSEIFSFLAKDKDSQKNNNTFTANGIDRLISSVQIDYDKKVIFVVLNSAWYSLGSSINEFLKDLEVEALKSIVKIKEISAEYGNQFIAGDYIEEHLKIDKKSLLKYIEDNPHYRVVTLMHHPESTLDFYERFNYEPDADKQPFFQRLKAKSDIILSGHNHEPWVSEPESLSLNSEDNRWHFKASMFLPDATKNHDGNFLEGKTVLCQSGFSILNLFQNEIEEKRYRYVYDSSKPNKWETPGPKIRKLNPLRFKIPQSFEMPPNAKEIIENEYHISFEDFFQMSDRDQLISKSNTLIFLTRGIESTLKDQILLKNGSVNAVYLLNVDITAGYEYKKSVFDRCEFIKFELDETRKFQSFITENNLQNIEVVHLFVPFYIFL